jgi:CelD/BcsL family acetyltransferase involved in cellulose biosynthesis
MLELEPADQAETFVLPRVSETEALSPASSSSMRMDIFHSFSEIEPQWRKAQECCDCYGFQTFDWLSTWHQTIGAAKRIEPRIVHVADACGNTLMLLPLAIQQRFGLSFLTFLGGVVTDYNAPIIRADFAASLDGAAVDRLMARILLLLPRVDVIALENLPSMIDGVANPLTRLPGAKHVCNAWVAALGDTFADFKKRRSAKFFSTAARKRRRLSEIAVTRLCIAETSDAVAEILQAFVRQKRRRWQEVGSPDLFAEAGYLIFYATLAEKHFNTGFIQTSALRVGDAVVATHWGMVFRNRFYWLMPTYEAGDWARFSVGRLLMQDLVEWSISQGIERFDLTIGDEAYKHLWADHTLPLHEYIRGLTVKGKIYRVARLVSGRIKEWAERSAKLRRIAKNWRRRSTSRALDDSHA